MYHKNCTMSDFRSKVEIYEIERFSLSWLSHFMSWVNWNRKDWCLNNHVIWNFAWQWNRRMQKHTREVACLMIKMLLSCHNTSLLSLCYNIEAIMMRLLEDVNICVIHAKRVTIIRRDTQLARKLQDVWNEWRWLFEKFLINTHSTTVDAHDKLSIQISQIRKREDLALWKSVTRTYLSFVLKSRKLIQSRHTRTWNFLFTFAHNEIQEFAKDCLSKSMSLLYN